MYRTHRTKVKGSKRSQWLRIKFTCEEGKCPIVIPMVVRIVVIGIHPGRAIIAMGIEHIRITVGVNYIYMISISPSLEYILIFLRLNFICNHNCLPCIPSNFIFEVSTQTILPETLISNIQDLRILISMIHNRNHAFTIYFHT